MSTASSSDEASLQLVSEALTVDWLSISVAALLAYEYGITFSHEVTLFWVRKKTGATWLFFAIRYLALLSYSILGGATYASMSDNSCSLLQKGLAGVQISQYLFWAAFSGLRTLALSNMNWPLASLVFVLASGPFAVNLWVVAGLGIGGENVPMLGCSELSNETMYQAKIGVGLARSCIIAADLLVLAVTLRYSLTNWRVRSIGISPTRLADVLIVNGFVYFFVLATLNTLQITLTLLSIVDVLSASSYITTFTDPLSAILICRFLIDLQSANQKVLDSDFSDTLVSGGDGTHTQTLRFAPVFIGSIAGTLGEDPGESEFGDAETAGNWGLNECYGRS